MSCRLSVVERLEGGMAAGLLLLRYGAASAAFTVRGVQCNNECLGRLL